MEYASVRFIHISCAVISVSLFALRGVWQLRGVDWRRRRWLRIAPHVNDTMLLSAAVALALMSHQYPIAQPWLTAKVVALLLYIGFGGVALSPRVTRSTRLAGFAAALLCVTYILWVARTRSPFLT
jgi:uncharacterized membrane protein SirB2